MNKVEWLPISRSLLGVNTFVDGVVEDEAVSAAQLNRVHPELAVDVLPEKQGIKSQAMRKKLNSLYLQEVGWGKEG